MKVITSAVRYPVSTTVGVLLLALFGGISLYNLPIQLTPDVVDPEITVTTIWPGASPQEVEREIIDEQEEQLKSLEGLRKMSSSSADSLGTITLTFHAGTDLDSMVVQVSNRLDQVPSYPETVEQPVITKTNVNFQAIAWFNLEPRGEHAFQGDISTLYDFADDFIKPEFERVPGVAVANIFGGRTKEVHVIVDPARLAARQVTMNELGAALERENRNYSAGDFSEGKRRYVVRTVGEYSSPEDIENVVIAVRSDVPIYVRDVAQVEVTYRKATDRGFDKERQVLFMNAVKRQGANVLEVMADLKETVARLNGDLLKSRGLALTQAYDETDYVNSAISLVQDNLWIGGALAITVLLLFLRSASSTLVIGVAIPISMVGTFLMMRLFGRTLNVISLAGLAFAVGMVVDNSIVVLENIYRHRQMGKSRMSAALDGAMEVWGAVLASTLTTVAVFVPVVFIKEEAGQLFSDIAIALSSAVALSLLVSITVIPSLSARILHAAEHDPTRRGYHNLWGFTRLGESFVSGVTTTVGWINASILRQLALVILLTGASVFLSFRLLPKTEYLPAGNQNFLFGIMLPPPGYSLEETSKFHDVFRKELGYLWKDPPNSPEALKLPGGGVETLFFVALTNNAFMGVKANDPLRVRELLPEFNRANAMLPGTIAFTIQSSIFQRSESSGRTIDIEITGPQLEQLIALGGEVFGKVMQLMPGAQARPIPSLDLGNPEVRVLTHRRRASELGISNRDLGFTVSALVDGAKVSDYQLNGREIDLKVRAQESFAHRTHLLEQMPIATPDGRLVTLGSVAQIATTSGPVQINHRERQRTITIQVQPSDQMPLQAAMEIIEGQILQPMHDAGKLGGSYRVALSGSADRLTQTGQALKWNFLLALAITYLLMASLFESFFYPFIIMFSVPLGAVGGFLGLAAVNAFLAYQPMDVLTMLGFIILIGTVVNNAILIVHQSLNHMREEGMNYQQAVLEATGNRIRPIFMTVATSAFGMLPLVLFPGAGSELYRGLGSVVVGGLVVSTIFTLILIPVLFNLTLKFRAAIATRLGGWAEPVHAPIED
ncbi:MAG: efflux RND transporter permease subunit [Acidobacteriota bacterium]